MTYVLISLEGGLIDEVTYFDDPTQAIDALAGYVQHMTPDDQDAAIYSSRGMVANAKDFLNDQKEYVDRREELLVRFSQDKKPVYIIGNPYHWLGFMVVSPDDPLGYRDPVEAISELAQLRQDHGPHLKLYRLAEAKGPLVTRHHLNDFNRDCEVDDLDEEQVQEFLK